MEIDSWPGIANGSSFKTVNKLCLNLWILLCSLTGVGSYSHLANLPSGSYIKFMIIRLCEKVFSSLWKALQNGDLKTIGSSSVNCSWHNMNSYLNGCTSSLKHIASTNIRNRSMNLVASSLVISWGA